MVHNRACPVCGKIVEWTKGELKEFETYSGIKVKARELSLICPEHGEFEPRVHERLRQKFKEIRL